MLSWRLVDGARSVHGPSVRNGYDLTNRGTDPRRSFLYVVDPATGNATKVGPTGQIRIEFGKLTFVPAGKSDK